MARRLVPRRISSGQRIERIRGEPTRVENHSTATLFGYRPLPGLVGRDLLLGRDSPASPGAGGTGAGPNSSYPGAGRPIPTRWVFSGTDRQCPPPGQPPRRSLAGMGYAEKAGGSDPRSARRAAGRSLQNSSSGLAGRAALLRNPQGPGAAGGLFGLSPQQRPDAGRRRREVLRRRRSHRCPLRKPAQLLPALLLWAAHPHRERLGLVSGSADPELLPEPGMGAGPRNPDMEALNYYNSHDFAQYDNDKGSSMPSSSSGPARTTVGPDFGGPTSGPGGITPPTPGMASIWANTSGPGILTPREGPTIPGSISMRPAISSACRICTITTAT